ncbi:hypothetical protein BYT27DRAFT_7185053 [Phlegmacium glaucopus]|nr:hypothetical protein BYT27DRAFT_7185053 [Phlegmacium glaucopus]
MCERISRLADSHRICPEFHSKHLSFSDLTLNSEFRRQMMIQISNDASPTEMDDYRSGGCYGTGK